MLLDLGRAFSFLLSILSLWYLMNAAFFVTATIWQQRLLASIACIVHRQRLPVPPKIRSCRPTLAHPPRPHLPLHPPRHNPPLRPSLAPGRLLRPPTLEKPTLYLLKHPFPVVAGLQSRASAPSARRGVSRG